MATGAAIGVGVVGAASSIYGASKQSSAIKGAAGDQTEALLQMFNISREDYAPYRDVGRNALYELAGYTPVTDTTTGAKGIRGNAPAGTRPSFEPTGYGTPGGFNGRGSLSFSDYDANLPPGGAYSPNALRNTQQVIPSIPGTPPETKYEQTGPGIDPTGGAGAYMAKLEDLEFNPGDITGGADKYKAALEELTFELDTNDPIYQWRLKEGEKAINQAAAARGGWNSRAAINQLSDYTMGLSADEVDRQYEQNYLRRYNQLSDQYNMALTLGGKEYAANTDNYLKKYAQLMDLYNMAGQLGGKEYGKLLDLANLGYGAAGGSASNALATGGQLSSVYGNMGAQNADIQGALYSGLGGVVPQSLATYNYLKTLQTPETNKTYTV